LLIPLKLVRDQPLQQQLFDQLRDLIAACRLQPGTRMPSTRMLAEQFSISRMTALLTYERLIAEGYLETLPAKGTFVARGGAEAIPLTSRTSQPSRPATVHGVGRPDPALFPTGRWRALTRTALDRLGAELAGEHAGGHPTLRAAIAGWLSTSRGLAVAPDQIILVNGRQQALHVAAQLLLHPGARVVVEDPCDPLAAAAFTRTGGALIRVPVDADGLCTSLLPPGQASLLHVTPEHQRPLGAPLSAARRHALLAWAERSGAVVLEEDCAGELRYHGMEAASLTSLDTSQRVILLGGFGYALGPWVTLGYLVVPPRLAAAAQAARRLIDDSPRWLEETALAAFLQSGGYARHVHRLGKAYASRRDALLASLSRHFGTCAVWGDGAGLHVSWFPPRRCGSAAGLATLARQCGLDAALVEGSHAAEQTGRPVLLGFGSLAERQIEARVARFAELSMAAGTALSAD
jgi:GntR family transcriptional regulator/MocR family aminotransferase